MKNGFAITVLFLFSLTMMGQIRDFYYPWGELELHVNALNLGDNNQDNLLITVWIPELGIYTVSNSFDLEDGETTSMFISLHTPAYAEGGSYIARLYLSSDDIKDVRYVWVNLY